MSNYSRSHHPQVVARKLADGLPLRNDYRREDYIRVLETIGRHGIRYMTLLEAWLAVRDALLNRETATQTREALQELRDRWQ
jgi:hypothetical protein